MSSIALSVIRTTRPEFLILTPVCWLLAWSMLQLHGLAASTLSLVLSLLGAILMHVSVNTLNEYFDFKSGLDLNTQRTSFSGGSGALPAMPEALKWTLAVGVSSLLSGVIIGGFFVYQLGWVLLPIGLLGVLLVIAYTTWINQYPLLCLIAPGLGFGPLMVVGTYWAMGAHYNESIWLVSLLPFFLVNNLLLLNQYPDMTADRQAGRRHLIIAYGTRVGVMVYGLFALASALTIVILAVWQVVPVLTLMALLPLLLMFYAFIGMAAHQESIAQYPHYLRANVLSVLLTLVLFSIGIVLGA